MAFDWIAGTALVVGVGSLALTWQSTRAAKKSIDTSIEIYEKQKKDSEIKEQDNLKLKYSAISILIIDSVNYANSILNQIDAIYYYISNIDENILFRSYIHSDGVSFVFRPQYDDAKIFSIKPLLSSIAEHIITMSVLDENVTKHMIKCNRAMHSYNIERDVLVDMIKSNGATEKSIISMVNIIKYRTDEAIKSIKKLKEVMKESNLN